VLRLDLPIIADIYYDDNTVGCPHATTEEQGYDHPGNPTPSGSSILATGNFNANTVRVVETTVLTCPTPPLSSIVSGLHRIGVGIAQIALPHGQR